ncbi:hypothetical protein ACJQWK_00421 [Exserohilum turcicum]
MSDEQPPANPEPAIAPTQLELVEDQDPSAMPPRPPTLTLILAATPSLGIGNAGTLPWPLLKKEMGFFARVTRRTTPSAPVDDACRKINAVLMGRKTWESIPFKFRPLKDRINVVITSKPEELASQLDTKTDVEGPITCSGILDALAQLERPDKSSLPSPDLEIDHVYVIGGASIYDTALQLPQTKRVLLTKIEHDFECDTFFPLNLDETTTWRNASAHELREFTGEEVPEDGIEEEGVKFRFCMYERVE